MNQTEFSKLMLKAENLFCPKNEHFGGINDEQHKLYFKIWRYERYEVVNEALELAWQADPEYTRKRILPPPAYFNQFIENIKNRYRTEPMRDPDPEIAIEVQKYRKYFIDCMTTLFAIKRRDHPANLPTYVLPDGNGKSIRVIDMFITCWQEFGQHCMEWGDFLTDVHLIAPDVAYALADKYVPELIDQEPPF